ncbi:hypothetical protein ASG90_11770 [Nocardioides sp. Soil797]|nr:hypothetical protein ASG90_11770 [Nocardioides sp. Soil797]
MEPRLRIWITGALCVALLAGCGEDDGSGDDAASGDAWRPDPSVPTEVGSDGFTPPGAVLSLGDTATVPLLEEGFMDDPDVTGALEVSVTGAPVQGSAADLPTDGPFADDRQGTPYYVTFTAKNVGDAPLEGLLLRLQGVDSEGESLDSLASSDFPECAGGIPQSFAAGESATTCSVVLVEDDALAAVGYVEAADYEDSPVLWDLT